MNPQMFLPILSKENINTHGSNIWDEKEIESRKKVFVELILWIDFLRLKFFLFVFRKR